MEAMDKGKRSKREGEEARKGSARGGVAEPLKGPVEPRCGQTFEKFDRTSRVQQRQCQTSFQQLCRRGRTSKVRPNKDQGGSTEPTQSSTEPTLSPTEPTQSSVGPFPDLSQFCTDYLRSF